MKAKTTERIYGLLLSSELKKSRLILNESYPLFFLTVIEYQELLEYLSELPVKGKRHKITHTIRDINGLLNRAIILSCARSDLKVLFSDEKDLCCFEYMAVKGLAVVVS